MLYRTSLKTQFQNINTNLNRLTWDMSRINNQVATGKKVNRPSDDPSGSALIFSMRTVLADVDQYRKDVALADDWLKQSESVLQSMKDLMEKANVIAEQMSTDTYRDENLLVAADEIKGLMESLVKLGNTRIEDRYIFAGQKTDIQPFSDELIIHDPQAVLGNSTSYTGQILSIAQALRDYQPIAAAPEQSKVFMIEVTTAGGVGGDSLANLTIDPPGNQNELLFTAQDVPLYSGANGNALRVEYVDPGAAAQPLTVTVAGNDITVSLATDGAGNIISTAQDVMNAVNADPTAQAMVTAELAPGSSGTGLVADTGGLTNLTGGVTGAAEFRVSEDGGRTWGPLDAYAANSLPTNIWNVDLGHATLTTNLIGTNNDLQFTAAAPGEAGNGLEIEYLHPGAGYGPPTDVTVVGDRITVNLETDAAGNIVATAQDVMNAINNHPVAQNMVTVSLVDPKNSGTGVVTIMDPTHLSGGDDDVSALGHADLTTPFADTTQNIRFTAVNHGTAGNAVGIEYVDPGAANSPLTVTVVGNDISISLETDADGDIVTTAQDIVEAIRSHVGPPDASDLVTAGLEDYTQGGDGVVEPMAMTRLTGGDDSLTGDQGVQIFFTDDGSTLQVGDKFEVEVSYYLGDDQDIFVNANRGNQAKINTTGEAALGEAGSVDNVLDTLARLHFALTQLDRDKVADELPAVGDAMERLATQMSRIGTRLNRNEFTYNVLSDTELSSTDRLSRTEDVDLTKAVTALQTKQMAYQALLATTSMITRLSLVDYIQ